MYKFKNINKLSIRIVSILFSTNLDGQGFDIGKSHQLSISFLKQTLTDDHLSLDEEKVNSAGVSWSYTDKTSRQQKSINLGFQYGDNINLKTSGYGIEYKNGYSIFRNRQINNYFGYGLKNKFSIYYWN